MHLPRAARSLPACCSRNALPSPCECARRMHRPPPRPRPHGRAGRSSRHGDQRVCTCVARAPHRVAQAGARHALCLAGSCPSGGVPSESCAPYDNKLLRLHAPPPPPPPFPGTSRCWLSVAMTPAAAFLHGMSHAPKARQLVSSGVMLPSAGMQRAVSGLTRVKVAAPRAMRLNLRMTDVSSDTGPMRERERERERVCVCVYTCTRAHTHTCVLCVCMYVCTYIYVYAYIHCMHVCMYYMYVCMCAHTWKMIMRNDHGN